jgi:hypothetical protein
MLTSAKNVRYAVIAVDLGVDANEDVKPLIWNVPTALQQNQQQLTRIIVTKTHFKIMKVWIPALPRKTYPE